MATISGHIGTEHYKVEIKSATGNHLIADEPVNQGGKNRGFSPKELLAAALMTCTSATIRMYADRKKWDLKEVKSKISVNWDRDANKTNIHREIALIGNLTDEQRERLLQIANKCPVHKMLSNPIEIETDLV